MRFFLIKKPLFLATRRGERERGGGGRQWKGCSFNVCTSLPWNLKRILKRFTIQNCESYSADREFRLISRELKFKRGHPLPVFFNGSHLTSASASIETPGAETRSHCRRDNCPVITERWLEKREVR